MGPCFLTTQWECFFGEIDDYKPCNLSINIAAKAYAVLVDSKSLRQELESSIHLGIWYPNLIVIVQDF